MLGDVGRVGVEGVPGVKGLMWGGMGPLGVAVALGYGWYVGEVRE